MIELAHRQLVELSQISEGAIDLLESARTDDGSATFVVSLDTSGITSADGGIPVRSRERFEISVDSSFPYAHPIVRVAHRRWARTPHVQWGRHLCLYAAPSVEWNPADGMRGLVSRLMLWVQQAAAGELDPAGQPLHPPVAYSSYKNGLVVVRPDLGELVPWSPQSTQRVQTVFALCVKRGGRVDVAEWLTGQTILDRIISAELASHDEQGNVLFFAPLVLISDTLDMEYPDTADALATALDAYGCTRRGLIDALVKARVLNRYIDAPLEGDAAVPAMMLLGTPARRVDPGLALAHITAWHLDSLGAKVTALLDRIDPKEQAELAADVRELADDWLKLAGIQWMVVREARPEVTRRRDSSSPMLWLSGKKVLVLGCGALGAPIAEQSVRAGVAGLHLMDRGTVTPGILVRQPYDDADIGSSKSRVLAQRLSRIRHDLSVDFTHTDVITALSDPTWLLEFDLVVDATADIGVRTRIEAERATLRNRWPATITALFGHTAQRGVAAISKQGATGSGHDILRRLAIDTSTDPAPGWGTISDDLFPNPPRTERFFPEPGCSDPTFTGSAAEVSALASTLFSSAISIVADTGAAPMTAVGHDLTPGCSGVRPAAMTWADDLILRDQAGVYEVLLSARALAEMRTEARRGRRVRGPRVETGGMLLGSVDEATGTVYVDNATGPSPDSALSAVYFDHGTEGTQETVAKTRRSTADRVGFLGMWHTHPYGAALPSPTDEAGMADIVALDGTGRRATMLILGGRDPVWERWIGDGIPPNVYARVVDRSTAKRPAGRMMAAQLGATVEWFPGGYYYPDLRPPAPGGRRPRGGR